MAYCQGEILVAPIAPDGVEVATADSTALNLDVHIVVTKRLGLEFVLLEVLPRLGAFDLEARELVGIRHG